MPEHRIALPPGFRYVNQFAPSQWAPDPSKMRCVTACIAMAAEFAYPNKWNPDELEHDLYVKEVGPDVPSDPNGTTKAELLDAMKSLYIGLIDMAPLIAQGSSYDALHAEITAQNNQDTPQIVIVGDESKLYDDTGKKLHAWADQGMSHSIFRIGYSDDQGYGLYYEPAAPGFAQPVHIPWSCIVAAGVINCFAVMGPGIVPPPAGFSYQSGQWPPRKPVLDLESAEQALHILQQAIETAARAAAAIDSALKS